ncbi:MAG: hypothetical protein ACLP7Q_05525 [Isosphaeraceae bacterium]
MNKDPSPGTRFKPGNPGRSRKAASVPQEPPPAAGQPDPPLDAETLHGRVLRTLSEVLADLDAETTHRLMAARLLEMIRVHNFRIGGCEQDVDAVVEALSEAEMTPVEQVDEPMDHSRVDRPECVALAVPPATPPCAPVMTVEPEPTAGPEVEPVHQVEPAGEPFPCFAFGDLEIFPGLGV